MQIVLSINTRYSLIQLSGCIELNCIELYMIEFMDAEPWIKRNHIQGGPTVKLQADFNQKRVGGRGGLSLRIVQALPVFLPSFKTILQSKWQ